MEIIGRLVGNAEVTTLKNEKKVVNFAIAISDNYKTREGEKKQLTTFINCSYWLSPAIAEYLTKGTVVSLYGRLGAKGYKDRDDQPKVWLTYHVNNIKIIASNQHHAPTAKQEKKPIAKPSVEDDLPF